MTRKSRKQRLSAREWDTVSKRARSLINSFVNAGFAAWGKRQMNRRWRREQKEEVRNEINHQQTD
jgi:hypothetical protein